MFMFSGLMSFAASVTDGLACSACSQRMCLIHSTHLKRYVSAVKPGDTTDATLKEKRDREQKLNREILLAQFDLNGDGKIDQKESIEIFKYRISKDARLKAFAIRRMDSNGDGILSDAEIEEEFKYINQIETIVTPKVHDPSVQPVSPSESKVVPPTPSPVK
jgi:hypothetical protein